MAYLRAPHLRLFPIPTYARSVGTRAKARLANGVLRDGAQPDTYAPSVRMCMMKNAGNLTEA